MRAVTCADTCDDTACAWLPVNNKQTALMRKWSTVHRNMFPDSVSVRMTVGNCVLFTVPGTTLTACHVIKSVRFMLNVNPSRNQQWNESVCRLYTTAYVSPEGQVKNLFSWWSIFFSKPDLNCFLSCVNDLRAEEKKKKFKIKIKYQE